MKQHTRQVLALAGIAQSAFLVNQLSLHGFAARDKLATCLNSLFVANPQNTMEVYGDIRQLRLGLQVLEEVFGGGGNDLKTPQLVRYLIGLVHLETKLSRQPDMMRIIGESLQSLDPASGESGEFSPEILEQLAAIYQSTISTLTFRIKVQGKMEFLKDTQIANTIRALLLAGIRSTVLWRQLGGKRWHFLLYRKRINRDIGFLLQQHD